MKLIDQQRALAKLDGWQRVDTGFGEQWISKGDKHEPPSYESLDDIHLFEHNLNHEQQMRYERMLDEITNKKFPHHYTFNWNLIHANVAQRRESILRTHNLWIN